MNDNKRVIPKKNYVIYFVIVLITVILTFYFCNSYKTRIDLTQEKSVMSSFLVSINENEFDNYVTENNNFIVYLSNINSDENNSFEELFKELILKYDLKSQLVLIDLNQMSEEFTSNLESKYLSDSLSNEKIGNYTNILVLEGGKITSILYNEKKEPNIEDVDKFFYNRGVVAQA